jgi:hypothetical protein
MLLCLTLNNPQSRRIPLPASPARSHRNAALQEHAALFSRYGRRQPARFLRISERHRQAALHDDCGERARWDSCPSLECGRTARLRRKRPFVMMLAGVSQNPSPISRTPKSICAHARPERPHHQTAIDTGLTGAQGKPCWLRSGKAASAPQFHCDCVSGHGECTSRLHLKYPEWRKIGVSS